jgi:hypothetical protein
MRNEITKETLKETESSLDAVLESFAKTEHQKQTRKVSFLCLDEESSETSNTGKGHTGVELASGTSVG